MQSNLLQQIHLELGPDGFEPVAQHEGDASTYVREHEEFQRALLRICPAKVWPKSCNTSACPRPVLMGEHHQQQLYEVHEALTVAVTDIVQRWWSDADARFPERMPLEAQEENLLQWIETQVLSGRLPEYSKCRGSWRPDFLVEEHRDSEGKEIGENFRITEINARFAFNGYMMEAYGQQALDDMGILARHGLKSAASAEKYIDGLLGLFRPDLPLHLLKGEEHGMDIHMFIHMVEQRLGVTPRLTTPQDLRLLPDENGKGGYKLCCVVEDGNKGASAAQNPTFSTSNGELVQEIHQVGLELHQHELRALDAEMLRQISLRCFNDMRTILLVHDKRMLGIVKQESALLVKRRILTTEQALILDKGIADTVLPNSTDLHELFNKSKCSIELKNEYLLKPIRGGKGAGILFGEDLSSEEWLNALDGMRSPGLSAKVIYVIQRRITPRLYNVVLRESGEKTSFPLVGTYHSAHGRFLGIGVWRSSGDRICAISYGGAWLCSVIFQNGMRWPSPAISTGVNE